MKKTKQDLKCENCDTAIGSQECTSCLDRSKIKNRITTRQKVTSTFLTLNKPIRILKSIVISTIIYEDGTLTMYRDNQKYNVLELVGVLQHCLNDINNQMSHPEQYKITSRKGKTEDGKSFKVEKK